jgi:hypothetical protein
MFSGMALYFLGPLGVSLMKIGDLRRLRLNKARQRFVKAHVGHVHIRLPLILGHQATNSR